MKAPVAFEKIKILGAVLDQLNSTTTSAYFAGFLGKSNGPNWQCCVAGSSKMAPRILIFSIVLGAKY
jgi:hypothetical protein